MPPKRLTKSPVATVPRSMHISSFFQKAESPKTEPKTKKRSIDEEMTSDAQSADSSPTPSPPAKRMYAAESKDGDGCGHRPPLSTPDSMDSIIAKKCEAEAKLWARKLSAETLGPSWMKALVPEFKKPYFTKLMEFVAAERKTLTVYPPARDVFSWTSACAIEDVKVVILGQDPYHGPNQAHGLCFSVRVGVQPPPSLINMYKELAQSIEDFTTPDHGYLMGWAKQGVLLLNACLTVRYKQPNSHAGKGWEKLTDAVIHWLNDHRRGVVFLLWGAYAQKKGAFIDKNKHHVLKSPHPSPLSASRGFFGCGHFTEVNKLLQQQGKTAIDWGHLPMTSNPM